jgi:plastocyanin
VETTLTQARPRARRTVSTLSKTAAVLTLIVSALLVYLQVAIIGMLIPPLAVFAALGVVFAGLMWLGFRWTPILGALLSGLILVMDSSFLIAAISSPQNSFPSFVLAAIGLPALVLSVIVGIVATVQNYAVPAERRRGPKGMAYMVTALAALVGGALLIGAIPAKGVAAEVSPEVMAGLPVLDTANFEFAQSELRVKAGETVAVRLTNADAEAHYLDIDDLNVHAPIPAGKEGLAIFIPATPGEYVFYCDPHYNKETGEGMAGKLIVE